MYLHDSTLIKLNFSELVKTVLVKIEKSSSFSKSDNIARYGKQQKLKDRLNFPGEEKTLTFPDSSSGLDRLFWIILLNLYI